MRVETKVLAAVIAAVAAMILAASAVCSWAIANGASPQWRLAFRLMCHGIESRCLKLFGVPMPICARCTAIYIGLVAGALLFFVVPMIQERVMRIALYLATVPMAIDGLTQATGLRESTNALRIATGLIASIAFAMWSLSAVEGGRERASPSTLPS